MMVTRRHTICNCILIIMLVVLTACPQSGADDGRDIADASGVSGKTVPTVDRPADLFSGTDYAAYEPLAYDIPRGLDRVYMKKLVKEGMPTLIESFELGDALGQHRQFLHSTELMRACVKGHPLKDECLLVSHRQDSPEEPIRDVLWRSTPDFKVELDYLGIPGVPDVLPFQTAYNTEPLYSWSGDQIVVLLNSGGLCVFDQVTGEQKYIQYPPLPGEPTGQSCRSAPSPEGRSYIVLSRWYIGRAGEWCQVALLDLVSGEWLRMFEINDPDPIRQWVIYEIAGEDLAEGPWLVRGARAPQVNYEHKRVPRLAMLDPDTGHVDLLMFHGDPYWPVALDPGGRYVVYTDQQRQGIVRLDLRERKLAIDPRWYAEDAQIHVGIGGDPVYVWSHTELIKADFSETEIIAEE